MNKQSASSSERRSFFAPAVALAVGGMAMAQVKTPAATRWEPTRHSKDDWMDQIPGQHRMVFDNTTPEGAGDAILFANNFLTANRNDYGLQNSDLALIVILRHRSTGFAYTDAMWAKYGAPIAARANFEDPKTKAAPKVNVYNSTEYGNALPNRGTTLEALSKLGVQFAVCSMATRAIAGSIATAVGGNTDAIFNELVANLISNARMVPAGIVAVNRAQERGYSLVTA